MSAESSVPSATPTIESIRGAAVVGLRWGFIGSVAAKVLGFASNLVLVRLLTPADFGLYAITLTAFSVLLMVNDMGLIAAVIQWRGDFREVAPTATVLAFGFSVIIYTGFWISAPSFSAFVGNPAATPFLRLIATAILIDGVTAVRGAYLLRTFRQDLVVLANICSTVVQISVSLVLALNGFGVLSLVVSHVAGSLAMGILTIYWARVPVQLGLDRAVARKLLRFGLPLALTLGVEAVLLNADYVVIGRVLGSTALGYYLLAFNLSSWLPNMIANAMRWVAVPSFSRISHDGGALSSGFLRSLTLLVQVMIPVIVLMGVFAPTLVVFLYGDVWAPAAGALQFLVVFSLIRLFTTMVVDVVSSTGRTSLTLWMHVGWGIVLLPALVGGTVWGGIRGTGLAHVSAGVMVVIPLAVFALRRAGVTLSGLHRQLIRPLMAGCVTTAACMLIGHLMTTAAMFSRLAVGGFVGLLIYLVIALRRDQMIRLGRNVVLWLGRSG